MAHAAEVTEISCSFEEGGCWTLAAVVHRVLSEIGNRLEMHYQAENFMHAWAAVDDIGYQSIKLNDREDMLIADKNAMEWLAAEHGNKLPDFYNDH